MSSEETSQLSKIAELAQFAQKGPRYPKRPQTPKRCYENVHRTAFKEGTSYLKGSDFRTFCKRVELTTLATNVRGLNVSRSHIPRFSEPTSIVIGGAQRAGCVTRSFGNRYLFTSGHPSDTFSLGFDVGWTLGSIFALTNPDNERALPAD